MAPRGTVKKTPAEKAASRDGAPPGSSAPGGKYAFDADARAKAREDAPVTIGELTFHRRRRNWEATRALREQLRTQEKASGRKQRLFARIDAVSEQIRGVRDPLTGEWKSPPLTDEAEIAALEAEVERLEDEVDAATDESDEAAYAIIALLLRDDEGNPPAIEHLKETLDVAEAGDLSGALSSGEDPAEGPTPTEATSS